MECHSLGATGETAMDDNRHAQGHESGSVTPGGEDAEVPVPRPVLFAIGDIHGNYDALRSIISTLQSRHRIFTDAGLEALADHVTLVFTGDYVDRGPHAIKVLDYLARMKAKSGNRAVMLMGNHEAMSLASLGAMQGHSRMRPDLSTRVLAAWRKHERNGGRALYREIADTLDIEGLDDHVATARAFLEEFGRGGRAGDLLRALELAYIHEFSGYSFLFSHGDVPRDSLRSRQSLEDVAMAFKGHVASQVGTVDWVSKYDEDLPGRELLWSRDYTDTDFACVTPEQEVSCAQKICDQCGVDFIVAGHTITHDKRIRVYGGRIFHIDVGMVFEGEPTALMVSDAGISSVTKYGDELLVGF